MSIVPGDLTDLKVSVGQIETSTRDMDRRLGNIEAQLRGLQTGQEALAILTVTVNTHEKRLSTIEDSQKWIMRLVLGAVITAVLSLVLAKTGLPIKL